MTSINMAQFFNYIVVAFSWGLAIYNTIYLLLPRNKKIMFFNQCCCKGYSCLTFCCILTSILGFIICLIMSAFIFSITCGEGTVSRCGKGQRFDTYFGILIGSEIFEIFSFVLLGKMISDFSKGTPRENQTLS